MALVPTPEDALAERLLRRRIAGEDMTGVTAALTRPSDVPPAPPIPTPPDLGNAGDVSRAVAAAITSDQFGPWDTLPRLASADPTMAAMGVPLATPAPDLVPPPPDPSARIAQAMLGSQAAGGDAGTAFESRPYMIDPWNRLWIWDDKANTWVLKFRSVPKAPPKPPTPPKSPAVPQNPLLRPWFRHPFINPDDPRYPPPPSRYQP